MKNSIGIDFRALAAFRIALGLVLLGDLFVRGYHLIEYYTDSGVLPRSTLINSFASPFGFSLFLINGSKEGVGLLFLITGMAYLCFILGYKTKLATFVSWIFLVSLQNRNPLILQGGDELARSLLFWTLFLPMGEYLSLDGLGKGNQNKNKVNLICSVASFALLFQVAMLYFFAGILKSGTEWTIDGTAIYYALSIDEFVKPFGLWQKQFPALLEWATIGTRYFEIFGPILFFTPWARTRILAFFLFVGFQMGLYFSLELGIFPFINIAALVPLLPGAFWEKIEQFIGKNSKILALRNQIYLSVFAFLYRIKSVFWTPNAKLDAKSVPKWRTIFSSIGSSFFLLYIFIWNLSTIPEWQISFPQSLQWVSQLTRIDQTWNLFAPFPYKEGGYFVIPGRLEDGSEVNAYKGTMDPPLDREPALIASTFSTDRERSYLMNLWLARNAYLRFHLAEYLCIRWNDARGENQKMKELKMFFIARKTLLENKKTEPEKILLWEGACPSFQSQ